MPAFGNVLVLSGLVAALALIVVLVGLDGFRYYTTPLRVRGYVPVHRLLRPSGSVGRLFGVAGLVLMSATLLYSVRKKSRKLSKVGSTKVWLEVHIFCGLVGPAFVTLHTTFKFNGVVSIAYWSMIVVVASGFVGRYLYVRIPKTLRGTELTLSELEARAAELRGGFAGGSLPRSVVDRIDGFELAMRARRGKASLLGFLFGDLALLLRVARLKSEMRAAGVEPGLLRQTAELLKERAVLLRRIAYLGRTKKLFELWHVFHKPFVYLMLLVAAVHVGIALYMGYGFVSW